MPPGGGLVVVGHDKAPQPVGHLPGIPRQLRDLAERPVRVTYDDIVCEARALSR
jgi:hypothetical protein